MPGKLKLFLIVALPVVIVVSILFYLITWNSSDLPVFPSPSRQLVEKIMNIPKNDGVITLNNQELNELIDLYPIGENAFGDLKVKAVYTEIHKGKFDIYLPSNYKGINTLLSTSGKPYLEQGRIVYEIDTFKAGKLVLPKNIIFDIIKNKSVKGLSLKDNKIFVDLTAFPMKMKDLQLKDDTITIIF